MKKWTFALSILLSLTAQAEYFTGSETWNLDGHYRFNDLDSAGVVMDAIEEAFNNCQGEGSLICALVQSGLSETGTRYYSDDHQEYRRRTQATATALSLDAQVSSGQLAYTEVYRETAEVQQIFTFSNLQLAGVRFIAFNNAVKKCFENGNAFCSLVNVSTTTTNNPVLIESEDNPTYANTNGFKSSATAVVRGYRLR